MFCANIPGIIIDFQRSSVDRPGFGWDRVSFHKKPGGLTQARQSNGIFDSM